MKKSSTKIISIVALIVIIGALAYPKFAEYNATKEAGAAPAAANQVVNAEVYIVEPVTVDETIFLTGTLLADKEIELRSEVSGLVKEIFLKEGQRVQKNQLLLKINDSDLQADLSRAQFRLQLAESREKRQKQLLEKGGISQEDYDATLNEVNVLRAEFRLIEVQIERTEIRAPFSGKIGLRYVDLGAYITPTSRISTLQNINPIKIEFSIPERYAPQVKVGKKIMFEIQGEQKQFFGTVYAIEPKINVDTRTLSIRAESSNDDEKLLPGSFARVELTLETFENTVMIPTESIIPELNGQKVLVIRNGIVEEQRVQTGLRKADKIQIIEGLSVGDTVLTTGILQARPGSPVNVTNL